MELVTFKRKFDVELNPAPADFKGLTNFICYRWNSVRANLGRKTNGRDHKFAFIIDEIPLGAGR